MSRCKTCGAPIAWATMRSGKLIPLNPSRVVLVVTVGDDTDGHLVEGRVSHFATCPDASRHRKRTAAEIRKESEHV